VQSLRADELADFRLIGCIAALNLLDQMAQVRVGETNSLSHDILPQGLIVISRDMQCRFQFHFKLTVRIRVSIGSGLELRLGLGSELQSGGKASWGEMFWGKKSYVLF
jgi:hypothetical protein